MMIRSRIEKRRRTRGSSYTKMLRTLLLQNQQIIIQQQNMMFMVIKQFQQSGPQGQSQQLAVPDPHHHQQQQSTHSVVTSAPTTTTTAPANTAATTISGSSQPLTPSSSQNQHLQSQPRSQHLDQQHLQQNHILEDQSNALNEQISLSQEIYGQLANTTSSMDTHQSLQQVTMSHENLGHYLTPAASEQDPISDDRQEEDDLMVLYDDGLSHNNLTYNPQIDIGSITPYKSQPEQHQTPSYYSSGCESLSTPRVEQQQRQPATANISHNVVKNLADSFKSPTKPKINVQFISNSASRDMKSSKAKIIQRMNIPKFLRSVHPDGDNLV